ncbi:hypothetical protein Nmel_011935 [Mimus melanotis]
MCRDSGDPWDSCAGNGHRDSGSPGTAGRTDRQTDRQRDSRVRHSRRHGQTDSRVLGQPDTQTAGSRHSPALASVPPQVSPALRSPRVPVWLCSLPGRLGVLFGTDCRLLSDWKRERTFQLYFCSGQQEHTRTARLTQQQQQHAPSPAAVLPGTGAASPPPSPPPPLPPPQQQQQQQQQDLTSLFECPICFDYVLPPILQCQAGHLVCNKCRQQLSVCPTCRGSLTPNIRNLAMEKVASAVLFPCKYATTGCSLTLHHTEKPNHEANYINLPGSVDWVMMQSCFGHHFMLVLKKKCEGHPQFFATVLLIGTRKQAENFQYRLELHSSCHRLTWEASPCSIYTKDSVDKAIDNSNCLVFNTATAHLFADNGNLGINVTISMCCP